MALTNKLTAIADAVRTKTGITNKLTLDEIAQAILSIEGSGGSSSNLLGYAPSYFLDEVVDTIQKVRLAMSESRNCIFIPFITDTHIHTPSDNEKFFDAQVAGMKAVCAVIQPTLIVHGGDMSNGSEPRNRTIEISKHVINCLKSIGGNDVVVLIGNHDTNNYYNNGSEPITETTMLTNFRNWNDGFTYPTGKLYGFRDVGNIRIIRLHSSMGDGTGADGNNWGYPADEVAWLNSSEVTTGLNGKDVLVFSHMTQTPECQGTQASNLPHNGISVRNILESWINKYNCKVIGFSGHCHWDYIGKHDSYYETTTCLANYLASMEETDCTPVSEYRIPPDHAVFRGRKINTRTQGLWDGIVINPDTHKVSMIRFGAGDDRIFQYAGVSIDPTGVSLSDTEISITEGDTITLTATISPENATNKTVSWSSSNKDIVSVSGGVVTALKSGVATITVKTAVGGFTATCSVNVSAKLKTNQLAYAVDTNDNLFNGGKGYKSGYRLSSSGGESALAGAYVTGFIPIEYGQTFTVQDFDIIANSAVNGYNYCYITLYDSGKKLIKGAYAKDFVAISQNKAKTEGDRFVSAMVIQSTGSTSLRNAKYLRFSAMGVGTDPAVFID